ncbi:hypothetical protein F25303_4762 [Fusarium sp. NRRL 25303]|nr:hypothetical protein F25303_4762 [Fusarium sp. NRRL 25303]
MSAQSTTGDNSYQPLSDSDDELIMMDDMPKTATEIEMEKTMERERETEEWMNALAERILGKVDMQKIKKDPLTGEIVGLREAVDYYYTSGKPSPSSENPDTKQA